MTRQFNAKFTFDNKENISYEDATASLRMFLKKKQKFKWEKEENAYQFLMRILEDEASTWTLYHWQGHTCAFADASEHGIQDSIYQEKDQARFDKKNIWVPIDHVSRALTLQEQRYNSIETKSLALS